MHKHMQPTTKDEQTKTTKTTEQTLTATCFMRLCFHPPGRPDSDSVCDSDQMITASLLQTGRQKGTERGNASFSPEDI